MKTFHEQKTVTLLGRKVQVDRGIASLLCALNNDLGLETDYSCQGWLVPKRSHGPEGSKAYISFVDHWDAIEFFDMIFESIGMVQVEFNYPRGRGVIRFYAVDLRRVVRCIKKKARRFE